jgi:hypothetical protein
LLRAGKEYRLLILEEPAWFVVNCKPGIYWTSLQIEAKLAARNYSVSRIISCQSWRYRSGKE